MNRFNAIESKNILIEKFVDDDDVNYIIFMFWNAIDFSFFYYFDDHDARYILSRNRFDMRLKNDEIEEWMIQWAMNQDFLSFVWTLNDQEWLSTNHFRRWFAFFHRNFSNERRRSNWTNDNDVFSWIRILNVRQMKIEREIEYRRDENKKNRENVIDEKEIENTKNDKSIYWF